MARWAPWRRLPAAGHNRRPGHQDKGKDHYPDTHASLSRPGPIVSGRSNSTLRPSAGFKARRLNESGTPAALIGSPPMVLSLSFLIASRSFSVMEISPNSPVPTVTREGPSTAVAGTL